MTLYPEVDPAVSAIKHDEGAIVTARHKDVLVNLSTRLDQQELHRLLFSHPYLTGETSVAKSALVQSN